MKHLKNVLRIFFITSVALFLPVTINYILFLPSTYIDGNSLAGSAFLSVCFYSIQAAIAIVLGRYIMNHSIEELGFNLKNDKLMLRMLGWFVPIWLLIVILFYVIGLNHFDGFDGLISHYFVKDNLVMQKDLIIGCFLAGIGEEPLYRGFVVTALIPVITRCVGIGKVKIPLVALISGLLFMSAHVEYQIMPFKIIYADGIQLGTTFVLGTFWAIMFMRTKSLVGPILAHMSANTIQLMIGYYVAYYIL